MEIENVEDLNDFMIQRYIFVKWLRKCWQDRTFSRPSPTSGRSKDVCEFSSNLFASTSVGPLQIISPVSIHQHEQCPQPCLSPPQSPNRRSPPTTHRHSQCRRLRHGPLDQTLPILSFIHHHHLREERTLTLAVLGLRTDIQGLVISRAMDSNTILSPIRSGASSLVLEMRFWRCEERE
jgi:hypothetical protein